MRAARSRALAATLCAAALACGGSPGQAGIEVTPSAAPEARYPIGVWTWVDVPGTACSDGSATGFAVNPGDQPDVVFFMDGGGACWDYLTCFGIRSAAAGPVQAAQFEAHRVQLAGTYLDRDGAANPFRGWTFVYVPYCTGDLHAGDRDATYTAPLGGLSGRWSHRGRANIAADLQVVVPALPKARRLAVGGSSAGGFGTLLQYDAIRKAFGAETTFLVDDSGPALEGDFLNPLLRSAWRSSWNLDPLLAQICPDCADDFSRIVPQLAGRYPQDRMALLSSLQDKVMRTYFALTPDLFQRALLTTLQDRYDEVPTARTFVVAGEDHALFQKPDAYSAGGVSLTTWLSRMIAGDPAWQSAGR